MYIAYKIEECGNTSFIEPIGLLKTEEEMIKFKNMSPSYIYIEEVYDIDMNVVKPINYIEFKYSKNGKTEYRRGITNTYFEKNIQNLNRAFIINGELKIVKVIEKGENIEDIYEKLRKIAPKLLLGRELGELKNSEDCGVRMDGFFVQIHISDLLKLL